MSDKAKNNITLSVLHAYFLQLTHTNHCKTVNDIEPVSDIKQIPVGTASCTFVHNIAKRHPHQVSKLLTRCRNFSRNRIVRKQGRSDTGTAEEHDEHKIQSGPEIRYN